MLVENTEIPNKSIPESMDWFDDVVSSIRLDQLLLESDLLEKQKAEVYKALIEGDNEFLQNYARKTSSSFFIKNLVKLYITELSERKILINRLAFELSNNSKVLVWAEIKDDDSNTEDSLILAEAKVNNHFYQYGFCIDSTIVEESDGMLIPNHYKEVASA